MVPSELDDDAVDTNTHGILSSSKRSESDTELGSSEIITEEESGSRFSEIRKNYAKSRIQKQLSIRLADQDDSEKKKKGQITSNENTEQNRVAFDIYKKYFSYVGGIRQILITNLMVILFIFFKTLADLSVGNWATADDQHDRYWHYCSYYFAFSFVTSIFVFLRVFAP